MSVRISHTVPEKSAEIFLPASKSESNRYLVLNALAGFTTVIEGLSEARDTRILEAGLKELLSGKEEVSIDCKDGGAPLRFMMAVAAILPIRVLFTGTARLLERPVEPLLEALRELGAGAEALGEEGRGPWQIRGTTETNSSVSVEASESSQFVSALMLVAPFLRTGLEIHLKNAGFSMSYIQMTGEALSRFGARYVWKEDRIRVEPGVAPPDYLRPEADWSSAAFPLLAADLAGMDELRFPGLRLGSLQGDSFLTRYVRYLGWKDEAFPEGLMFRRGIRRWEIRPLTLNLGNMPDLAPPAVIHAWLKGMDIRYYGLESLARKESVRDRVLGEAITRCGGFWKVDDGCWHYGGGRKAPNAELNTQEDHRMAMAFCMMAIPFGSVKLSEIGSVEKSFPAFRREMEKVGLVMETFGHEAG